MLGCVDDENWECPGWWVEKVEPHEGDAAASLSLLDAESFDASLPWGARSMRPSAAEWTDDTHHQLAMTRLRSFVQLRTVEATPGVRLVLQLAPPGASAPPVSSAGQGRLLLAAAALAAALPSGGSERAEATQTAQQLYRGWRAMAAVSWDGCESTRGCGATGGDECFPAWLLTTLPPAADGTIALARGTLSGGNSSDAGGDVDGVLGLVLLTLATEAEQPEGWRELAAWTYASCRVFLLHLSSPSFDDPAYLHKQQLRGEGAAKAKASGAHTRIDDLAEEQLLPLLFRGAPYASIRQQRRRGAAPEGQHATAGGARMLRLSSCSGGWACTKPGLHSPAHYRAMRDFMLAFAGRHGDPLLFGDAAEGERLEPLWDALIATSHMLLHDVQSPTGLVPNSARPMCLNPGAGAAAACAGCGEADGGEFGVSASAVAWRVYLDAVWWPHEQPEALKRQPQLRRRQLRDHSGGGSSYGATTFVDRLAAQAAAAIMQPNATARRLNAGNGLVSSTYGAWDGGDWPEYPFMLGPMTAALMLRPSTTQLPSSAAADTGSGRRPPPPPLSVQAAEAEAAEAAARQRAKETELEQRQRALDHAADMLSRLQVGVGGSGRHGDPFADEWLVLSIVTVGGALPSLAPALRALRDRPRAIPDSWGTDPFLPYPPPPPSPLAGFYSDYFAPPPPLPPSDALGRAVNTLAIQETFTLAGPICLLLCALGAMLLRLRRRMKIRALVAKVPGPRPGAVAAAARRRPASRAADAGVSTALGRGFGDARRKPRVVPRPERPATNAPMKPRRPQGKAAKAETSDARSGKQAKQSGRRGWFGALGLGAGKAESAGAPAAVEMASASLERGRAEEDEYDESDPDGEEEEYDDDGEERHKDRTRADHKAKAMAKAASVRDNDDGDDEEGEEETEEDERGEEDEELVTTEDDEEGEGHTTRSLFVVVSPGKKSGASFLRGPKSNVVARVARGSNAETAGLCRGDEVVRVDGDEVGRGVAVGGLLDAPVAEVGVRAVVVARKTSGGGRAGGGGVSGRKAKQYGRLQENLSVF